MSELIKRILESRKLDESPVQDKHDRMMKRYNSSSKQAESASELAYESSDHKEHNVAMQKHLDAAALAPTFTLTKHHVMAARAHMTVTE